MQNIEDRIRTEIDLKYKKYFLFTLDHISKNDIDSRKELLHETIYNVLNNKNHNDIDFNTFDSYFRGAMKFSWLNKNRDKYKMTSIEDMFNKQYTFDDEGDNYERYYEKSDYKLCSYNEGEKKMLRDDFLSLINEWNGGDIYSEIIELYESGYTMDEIGMTLKISKSTVYQRLNDIRESLGNEKSNTIFKTKKNQKTIEDKKEERNDKGYLYKGVHFHSEYRQNKWAAQIWFNKKYVYIGAYETQELAAIAYNNKAIELFGDKAKLNPVLILQ